MLLNYVSKLLFCEALPKWRELWRHVVLHTVLNQLVVKTHVSSFLPSVSLGWLGLNLGMCILADVHDTKVVI